MESSRERDGKRKNEEESSGMDFIGAGRSGTTRARPISPATWGRRERRWEGIQNRIPPLSCAGAAGRRGERAATWHGRGDVAWARGKRGRWGEAAAVSGVVTGAGIICITFLGFYLDLHRYFLRVIYKFNFKLGRRTSGCDIHHINLSYTRNFSVTSSPISNKI
jgi:hypothetical protein